jgi:hypothetical protein
LSMLAAGGVGFSGGASISGGSCSPFLNACKPLPRWPIISGRRPGPTMGTDDRSVPHQPQPSSWRVTSPRHRIGCRSSYLPCSCRRVRVGPHLPTLGFLGRRCAAGGRRPRWRTLRPVTMTTGALPSVWLQAGCDTQSHPAGQQRGGDGSSASETAAPSARPKRTPAVRLMWSRPKQVLRHDATSIRRGRSPSTSGVMAVTARRASAAAAESSGTASPKPLSEMERLGRCCGRGPTSGASWRL